MKGPRLPGSPLKCWRRRTAPERKAFGALDRWGRTYRRLTEVERELRGELLAEARLTPKQVRKLFPGGWYPAERLARANRAGPSLTPLELGLTLEGRR